MIRAEITFVIKAVKSVMERGGFLLPNIQRNDPADGMEFEKKTVQEVCRYFQIEEDNGLTQQEAEKRLAVNGKNELEQEKSKTPAAAFLEQLNDPLICVLLVAAFVSFLLKEVSDAIIIAVVIIVNATVGVIQEGKAQRALDSLKKLTSPNAVVRRDGRIMEISAAELVVGDVVILEAGAQVPADLRLLKTWNLKVEESALTGESLPVEKDAAFLAGRTLQIGERRNEAFMSTLVTGGRGEGVVIASGMKTEIGKIASIIKAVPREYTPLQKKLAELGRLLSIVSILLCVLLFGIAVLQHRNIPEMLITAISLAVAAVPEGLPAVVTIVLAMSVSKMVKVNTIVRKLPSVETLGAVNVVCSDKTGTLTKNKMTVTTCYVNEKVIPISKPQDMPEEFLRGFVLCNDAVSGDRTGGSYGKIGEEHDTAGSLEVGDPTELALLHMAEKCGIRKSKTDRTFPRVGERSFDSTRKMMTTVHQSGSGLTSYTKGAPDVVLKRCTKIWINGKIQTLNDAKRRKILKVMEEMSSQALRVLALSMKTDRTVESKKQAEEAERSWVSEGKNANTYLLNEEDLIFLGLAGMKDPIRPEAKAAVEKFKGAGVRTIMITGDHADTAFAIAKELGIAKKVGECITGEELEELSDIELGNRLLEANVFARVSPEHKVRIVKVLKKLGNVAAMTGDGVNDAPSLRMADIGIAMGKTGTDVAKNASDMILTDDNFATIEKAIEEGRSIYQNIKKTVLFLLSSNFGEIITMFTAVLLGLASPLKASHILWINLITDSMPALALGVDQNDKEVLMKLPPRGAKESLFANGGLACTIFYGVLIAVISLTAFLKLPWEILSEGHQAFNPANISVVLQNPAILARAQTYAFTVLGISQLFHAWGMRDVRTSVFSKRSGWNPLMAGAFVIGLGLQMAVTEVPYLVAMFGTASLAWREWGMLLILAAFPVLAHEVFVVLFRMEAKRGQK